MLVALRRASLCGARNQSPSCVVAIVTVAVVALVNPDASAIICGTFFCDSPPRKLTVRASVPVMATSLMFGSASSAASIWPLSSGDRIRAVVLPPNVRVKVPPVGFATVTDWLSFVFMSLNGGNDGRSPSQRACRRR